MLSDTLLNDLKQVGGYKASGVMDHSGDILVSDSQDETTELAIVGATFNDIFRSAQEACGKIGFERANELQIKTPRGVVLMRGSGQDSETPVHLIAVLDVDGNYALMKMMMAKLMPSVVAALA